MKKIKKCRRCAESDPNKLKKIKYKNKVVLENLCLNCYNSERRERAFKNKDKVNAKRRENYKQNKERIIERNKKWRKKNRNQCLENKRKHYKNNSKAILRQQKEKYLNNELFRESKKLNSKTWEINNREKVRQRRRAWSKKNKEKVNKYRQNRIKNNIQYKLRYNISAAIGKGLKRNNSSKFGKSCLKYLPYTIEQLKLHLESLFEPWMNWKNWGKYAVDKWDDNDPSTWKWQLDHIIPHSRFKYTSMEDQAFKDCWALSNLRPYSAKQNILDNNRKI